MFSLNTFLIKTYNTNPKLNVLIQIHTYNTNTTTARTTRMRNTGTIIAARSGVSLGGVGDASV